MKPKATDPATAAHSDNAAAKTGEPREVFHINALWFSYAHTICAFSAFACALIVGSLLHYHKIVTNEFYSYPLEWFPSVSATIGDRYPERAVFQYLIAVTSFPRFSLCFITYILTAKHNSKKPMALLIVGILRSLSCGGWTYVTSGDDHDTHDVAMVVYILLTIPYMVLRIKLTPKESKARKYRVIVASIFYFMMIPLVTLFVRHKVYRVAGAYSYYAYVEWSLIALDITYDGVTAYDFGDVEITVVDLKNSVEAVSDVEILRYPDHIKQRHSWIGYGIACFLWFVFWSNITSLGVAIWYFPLWYMGLSGYEVLLLAVASPIILVVKPIRDLLSRYPQLTWVGASIGISAVWVHAPENRIWYISAGAAFASLALAINFSLSASRPGGGLYQGSAFVVGLIFSNVAKMHNYTNNPIWPITKYPHGGINGWGVSLCLVGAAFSAWCLPPPHSSDKRELQNIQEPVATKSESAILAGLGAGSLLFALQTWLSDTSNLPLWVWNGYPSTGPFPVPHGIFTLIVMCVGLYTGITAAAREVLSLQWAGISVVGLVMVLNFTSWLGYAGGLVLAFYLSAITPHVLNAAGRFAAWKAFGLALLILVISYFAETWTVGYAFVPAGWTLRERSWLVMTLAHLFTLAGVYNARVVDNVTQKKSTWAATTSQMKTIAKMTLYALTIVLAMGVYTMMWRNNSQAPFPRKPEEKILTAGIWTVHFGVDNDMWVSEHRMRDLIWESELDVVGLLETDTQRVIGGHRDMTQQLAEQLSFYADYGPGPEKHTWGAALLSRFPILRSEHHLMPSPVGELAPLIHAVLDVYGEEVEVFVFHSGQEEDPEDRRLQTEKLAELMGASTNPTILLSYLVTKPGEGNYNTHVSERTGMHDIDPSDWDRWCEYILYKNIHRTGYARISRSTITDTELQVGRFVIGEKPDYSNERISEDQVPEGRRFPAKFMPPGFNGHEYHVFDEPRYFA